MGTLYSQGFSWLTACLDCHTSQPMGSWHFSESIMYLRWTDFAPTNFLAAGAMLLDNDGLWIIVQRPISLTILILTVVMVIMRMRKAMMRPPILEDE